MTKTALPLLAIILVLVISGCSSTKSSKQKEEVEDAFNIASVNVMVEGKHRGVTPATVQVTRSWGEYEVVLLKGREIVRVYEIGHGGDQRTPERHIINMDLERDLSAYGYRTFDLSDLESPNDTLYFIPYIGQTIAIDDREYGLTLVVAD